MNRAEAVAFAQCLPEAVLVVTPDGCVVGRNNPAVNEFGPCADLGARIFDLTSATPHEVERTLSLWRGTRQLLPAVLPLHTVGRGTVPYRCEGGLVVPPGNGNDPVLMIRCVPQQAASARFVWLNEQIDNLNRELRVRKAAEQALSEQALRLARANIALEQFAYATTHDLREPLRTISIFTEMLQKRYGGHLPEDAAEVLNPIISASKHMGLLIKGLLSVLQATLSSQEGAEPVPALDALNIAVANLNGAIVESGARIVIQDCVPELKVDRSVMIQIFQNLIGNAIKYRKEDEAPVITVSCQHVEDEWRFSVRDNGQGIPAAYHEHIFGLFKRLDPDAATGTGIGLALCRKVIEQYGGRIWVQSEEGVGSEFLFTLPRKESVDDVEPATDHASGGSSARRISGEGGASAMAD